MKTSNTFEVGSDFVASPTAKIIPLPTAAAEPVRQHPRRGRFPAIVTRVSTFQGEKRLAAYRASLNSVASPAKAESAESSRDSSARLLGQANEVYLICKGLHDVALAKLRVARQQAGLSAVVLPIRGALSLLKPPCTDEASTTRES